MSVAGTKPTSRHGCRMSAFSGKSRNLMLSPSFSGYDPARTPTGFAGCLVSGGGPLTRRPRYGTDGGVVLGGTGPVAAGVLRTRALPEPAPRGRILTRAGLEEGAAPVGPLPPPRKRSAPSRREAAPQRSRNRIEPLICR